VVSSVVSYGKKIASIPRVSAWRFILALIPLSAVNLSLAQPFVRSIAGIPFVVEGTMLLEPFTGGINNPQHQFVDIDGDGDLDLFVFDSDGSMTFFRSEGTPQAADFRWCGKCVTLPQFAYWFVFADLNGDGKIDLCTDDSSSGVRYYANTGTAQIPDFVLLSGTMLDSSGLPVLGAPIGAPTFADINGDSLPDYFSSNVSGSFNYYQNVGTRSSPLFKFITGTFQNITILGDTCPSPSLNTDAQEKHGGGILQFADIDANGTKDMFYGDLFSHGVFFMKNIGTPAVPQIQCVTSRFPDPSMVTTGFNQPTLADIDGDGMLDLFVGVLNFMPRHNFWYFKNAGTPSLPSFRLQTQDFLPSIDVGNNSHPAFVDIDGNGMLDLFVGSLDGRLWCFTNNGTVTAPSFILTDTAFAGISGNFTYAPSFVDIDADGDQDLFIGRFDGKIKFYNNTGTPSTPNFAPASSPVDTMNFNRDASPAFVDIDADGDADLFVGRSNGTISFFRNDGNYSMFMPVLVVGNFAGISVGEDAVPTFVFNRQHRCYDLVIGNAQGKLHYFENVSDSANPQFVDRTDHYADIDPMQASSPVFTDIDADGDPDLIVGTSRGGLEYYRNDLVTAVAEERSLIPQSIQLSQNYPNPFNPRTHFGFRILDFSATGGSASGGGFVSLRIYDLLGREVETLAHEFLPAGSYNVVWSPKDIPTGVYFYRLDFSTSARSLRKITEVKKMLFMK